MKNTMKKILSILLAVIILLSVLPVAFASKNSVKDAFIEEYIKNCTYRYNLYGLNRPGITPILLTDTFQELLRTNDEENMIIFTKEMKEQNSIVEEKIVRGELTVTVDTSDFIKAYIELAAITSDPLKMEMFIEIKERNLELFSEVSADGELLDNFYEEGESGTQTEYYAILASRTQAEFDAIVERTLCTYRLVVKHLKGDHDFVEYISDNDTTEESDGTKTAICEFCGATDTIIEESNLVNEPTSFAEKIVEFFKNLFKKIITFFENLFERVVNIFRNLF